MTDDSDHIRGARLDKLGRLEAAGVRGYPTTARRTHTAREVVHQFEQLDGQQVCVVGRLEVARTLGRNLTFVFLDDGSGRLQLVVHPQQLGEDARQVYDAVDPGDFVSACGQVHKTRTGEISIDVAELTLLSKALRNPPEKWHGISDPETRYRQRYLDLLSSPETRAVFVTRSRLISAIRWFLDERGFLEVETPVLQQVPGGGAARPFATELERPGHHRLSAGRARALSEAADRGRLRARLRDRSQPSATRAFRYKHNPEFTMLELY